MDVSAGDVAYGGDGFAAGVVVDVAETKVGLERERTKALPVGRHVVVDESDTGAEPGCRERCLDAGHADE
ncbi:hypothetical protein [Streptosporangium amethystogenes]|uniref:hypothetical protein n=1 Tax=Streptosporangium amethystogenes TaxID=2002 RepID=UPI0012FB24A1|nr:hypothetical protein [Streptosporangium amethystogenes]